MTGNQTEAAETKQKSLFGSMYASLGIHVSHKKNSDSKSGNHPSFHLPHHRGIRGEVLMGIMKRGHQKEHEDGALHRTASAPEAYVANNSPPSVGSPSSQMMQKGFVEIRRHRILGYSWTRVWMVVSPGEIHVVQNIPTSHHVYKLKDFHLSPACCKGNNIFILTPNEELANGTKEVGNKLIFRVPNQEEKTAWIQSMNYAKDAVETDTLTPATEEDTLPRRSSLPDDFGSPAAKELDSVQEDEAEHPGHKHEHADGERCECCGSPVAATAGR